MFDVLKRLLSDLGGREPAPMPALDERLATAALLVHAVGIDGTFGDAERRRIEDVLARRYGLHGDDLAALLDQARAADGEAVDLYGFTSVLKRSLPPESRAAVVELLWEAVLADGSLHEFEDNVVWRVAELLDIGTRDRVLLRKKVEERLGIDDVPG
ncbi:tellurite resistance TerB family protein [Prosthecomicrobium sp. N25]|uniref:tellurite resistance TerB family protein n=1 Tax=Prosthecomicrobium sp. N25 TaxID=3129254 RepID=UPI00307747C0